MALLSKSKYIAGLRCPKLLWIYSNDYESIPEPSESAKYFINQGSDLGVLAQKLFPNGRLIKTSNFRQNLMDSKTFLALRIPLFEPAFIAGKLYARADILEPNMDGSWNIYEVKSSTTVRDEQVRDVAFQRFVFTKAGLIINKIYVIVVNNNYLYDGNLNIKEFFRIEEVTDRAKEFEESFEKNTKEMLDVMNSPGCPDTPIHPQCKGNRYCEMLEKCTENLPLHNVTTLVSDNEGNGMKLIMNGIYAIKDIPQDYELNAKQEIQRKCIVNNEVFINKEKIREFLNTLQYPLYFLDFETLQKGLPYFANCHPYQQVPFQYSLHVINNPGEEAIHYEYLHNNSSDPRPQLFNSLKEHIGTKGSILVYFEEFEKGRLREACEAFPENTEWISGVLNRIVDLFTPFKSLNYYNPEQCGSLSLKKVLPALTGNSYSDLEITSGDMAPATYIKCYFNELITEDEQRHMREELLKYCGRDTEAMIMIIRALNKLVE